MMQTDCDVPEFWELPEIRFRNRVIFIFLWAIGSGSDHTISFWNSKRAYYYNIAQVILIISDWHEWKRCLTDCVNVMSVSKTICQQLQVCLRLWPPAREWLFPMVIDIWDNIQCCLEITIGVFYCIIINNNIIHLQHKCYIEIVSSYESCDINIHIILLQHSRHFLYHFACWDKRHICANFNRCQLN